MEEVRSLKEKNKHLQERLDSATKENVNLKEEVDLFRNRLVKQEDYSRRENLRFYNIPENPEEANEECVHKVKQVSSELGVPPDTKFHAIHLTGKPNAFVAPSASTEEGSRSPRPKPILLRFVSRMDADSVWSRRKELLKSSRFSSVSIDKDVCPESARTRAKLRADYKKAKDLDIDKVLFKGKNLIINGNKYSVDNLPEYLLPNKNDNTQRSPNAS